MTTRTLTLTEFLLARIAEDEAAARESYEAVPPAFGAYGRLMLAAIDYLIVDPDRVLADCEAKRRIVEVHRNHERDVTPYGVSLDNTARFALEDVCRTLASSYSDHPDYRQEWRP